MHTFEVTNKALAKQILQSLGMSSDNVECKLQIIVGQRTVVEGTAEKYQSSIAPENPRPTRLWPALN